MTNRELQKIENDLCEMLSRERDLAREADFSSRSLIRVISELKSVQARNEALEAELTRLRSSA